MGRPVDRSEGVLLVTDYGALEWALKKKKNVEEMSVMLLSDKGNFLIIH